MMMMKMTMTMMIKEALHLKRTKLIVLEADNGHLGFRSPSIALSTRVTESSAATVRHIKTKSFWSYN